MSISFCLPGLATRFEQVFIHAIKIGGFPRRIFHFPSWHVNHRACAGSRQKDLYDLGTANLNLAK